MAKATPASRLLKGEAKSKTKTAKSQAKQRRSNSDTLMLGLAILNCIPKKPLSVSAQEIKNRLDGDGISRTERTIQRTLKELCDISALQIECNKSSKPFSYSRSAAKSDLSWQLAPQESLLLLLAKQYLSQLLPANIQKNLEKLLRSAEYVVLHDDTISDRQTKLLTKQWPQKVMFIRESQPLQPPAVVQGVFETVTTALYQNKELELLYRNASGEVKEMRVQPLGLAQQGERVYLVCHIPKYQEQRTLALHRIQRARATTLSFERPSDFNLKEYDSAGRFGYRAGAPIELTIEITKEAGAHLLESKLHPEQKVQVRGKLLRITAEVIDNSRLDSWLNSFGEDLRSFKKKKLSKT